MGKSQKKRAMRRHNPMRVPDSHIPKGLASASSTSSKTQEILPILQKMESPDADERKWACVAVSNLIQNDPSTRRLLQGKNIVGALINRLTDSEEEVLVEAVGSLRNLCIDGGYDICAEMFNKNILAPLKSFIPKIGTTLSQYLESTTSPSENVQKIVYEFADNVITIIWCLSETSNKALNAINDIHLVPFLMSFLAARDNLALAPVTAAAQCLYVLTDDNQPAISAIQSGTDYISCLHSVISSTEIKQNGQGKELNDIRSNALKVLAAGMLRNISSLSPSSSTHVDKDIVLPVLQPVITSISLPETAKSAQEAIDREASEPKIEKLSLKGTPKTDYKSDPEKTLERLEAHMRTVQLALEILTGVCATLPDPDFGVSEQDDDGDEGVLGEGGENDAVDLEMEEDASVPQTLPFLSTLVLPLLELIQPTSLSFPPLASQSPHPPTTSALSAIHIGALECLNNIFLSLSKTLSPTISDDHDSGRKIWERIWTALAAVGTETGPGQERRQEMWEIAVGVLWGVGRIWKGALLPNEEQVNVLIRFCEATPSATTRVKCIGALECLAQHPDSVAGNKLIADYLVSVLPSSGQLSRFGTEPLIQALSALIDIYSDETLPYDINFREEHYLARLVSSVEEVKKAIRGIDRKKEGNRDLKRHGEEVRDNLVAFIQYRKELGF